MPPKSKKRKLEAERNAQRAETLLDREIWPGWCELESDPALFNVMLSELGVKGIRIEDVFSLDESMLADLPKPLHALIFLFQYKGNDLTQQETSCPAEVWFANQIPDFNCASLALLNIVNNIPGLQLGDHLQSFRDFTSDMTPIDRGYAVDGFDFLRSVHNSFARELDMLNANMSLKYKHQRISAKKRLEARAKAQALKDAEREQKEALNGLSRATRKRKPAQEIPDQDEDDLWVAGEESFHFMAYMPINGAIWSMDGMDGYPRKIGDVTANEDWISTARADIQARMAQYEAGAHSFNLMAAVGDPVEKAMRTLERREEAVQDTDAGVEDDAQLEQLRIEVAQGLEARQMDINKAMLRRHDLRPFFTAWVEALQDADVLDTLAAVVKAGD